MMRFKRSVDTRIFHLHSMEDVKMIWDKVMGIEHHSIKMIGKPVEVIAVYYQSKVG